MKSDVVVLPRHHRSRLEEWTDEECSSGEAGAMSPVLEEEHEETWTMDNLLDDILTLTADKGVDSLHTARHSLFSFLHLLAAARTHSPCAA